MNKKNRFKQATYRFKRFENKSYSAFNSMHKAVSIGVLSLAVLNCCNVSKASAQNVSSFVSDSTIEEHTLQEIQVNASPLASPINQIGRIVKVISQKEIQASAPGSLQDLLNYVSSVDVQTRGGGGVQADISIRGGTFDQTAILLNGVNISNPQTGHYSFDLPINISDIERIEILSGPAAIIYGSSAFSGGINIVTKKGMDKHLFVNMQAGEHKFFSGEVSGALRVKNVENYLSVGYKFTDGYIANSDYKIANFLYQSRILLGQNKIDLQAGYNNKSYGANTFYSDAFPNQHDSVASFLVSARGEFGDKVKFLPTIYWNRHNDHFQLDIYNPAYDNYHQCDAAGGGLSFQLSSKIGVTNFGSDLRYEGIKSSVLGKPMQTPDGKFKMQDSRTNISVFVQHNYTYKRLFASLGLLTFNNSATKQKFRIYPSLNVNYKLAQTSDIYASFSSSSRLPTFTDLYYTTKSHISNPDLKQEESLCAEFGVKNSNRFIVSHLSVYYMKGKNMIDWVKKAPEDKWQSANITQLDKYGLEVGGKIFVSELLPFVSKETTLQLDYNYLLQQKAENGYISNYVLNYLKNKLTAKLYTPLYKDKLFVVLSFRLQKREGEYLKYASGKPTTKQEYPLYTTTDVSISYNCKAWKVYLNLNNIFDTQYFDFGSLPQPGFWLIGGVSFEIGK